MCRTQPAWRQEQIARDIADAKGLIAESDGDEAVLTERLEMLIQQARRAGELYASVGEDSQRQLSQAVFDAIVVDLEDEDCIRFAGSAVESV